MRFKAARHDYDTPRFKQLQDLVDGFFADLEGLSDLAESDAVAELEHAALVLRAPFDALGAPPAAAVDLAMSVERRGDELAANVLAALAVLSHQPLAGESANALVRLRGGGTISSLSETVRNAGGSGGKLQGLARGRAGVGADATA